jgi:hypothetical protein
MKVDLVGLLHVAAGGVGLGATATLGAMAASDPDATGIFLLVVGPIATLWGLAHAAAGFGLLQRRRWSRLLALVLGAFQLLNAPFGLLVGIPTLMVLVKDDALAEPNAFRSTGARLGCAAGALLGGAAAFPTEVVLLLAFIVAAIELFEPRAELTSEQTAAVCRITDVPTASPTTKESTERTGPMLHYRAEAGNVVMVVRAAVTDRPYGDTSREATEGFDPREHLFAVRHGLRFEEHAGIPFDATYGHWATSVSPPGATMQAIHDNVNLTVSLAGIAPSDVHELDRWFGRCWSALHALPPAED